MANPVTFIFSEKELDNFRKEPRIINNFDVESEQLSNGKYSVKFILKTTKERK